jgi:hypothetical protein
VDKQSPLKKMEGFDSRKNGQQTCGWVEATIVASFHPNLTSRSRENVYIKKM